MLLFTIFTILFIIVSFAMVLIILVQRPQGGGLATAFGGAGGGNDTAFGGRTGDALTVATVATFFLYLALAIGLNITDSPRSSAAAAEPEATTGATGESLPVIPGSGQQPASIPSLPPSAPVTMTPPPVPAEPASPPSAAPDQPTGDAASPPATDPGTAPPPAKPDPSAPPK